MATFEHVLVPVDGSEAARRAAEHAIDLVSDTGGRVTALYVIDMGDADYVAVPSDIAETKKRIRKKGEELTAEIEELAAAEGVDCETAVVTGIADEAIVAYAEDNDVDLIAMGKHGKRDPDKPLVGNTARRVVQESSVPVHTV
ncbi:Nucleotide-binding universal stress protein, UspA family [Haloplanus vescus]|uniref:Nucleotide-binding universal stress protein, UspA family n=1 Tax=Haloplanus vescus TaxID=555874 RepID=A0A1H3WPF7_9EURY|nr:universal stress protein [Haloplanus vescus]SDZ89067.1 Nucleotide-binding universal stress protein, UspA family [Haloplanus vescus]